MIKQLPSTYIKFWWSYKLLNLNDKLDQLIIILAITNIVNRTLKTIMENKQK